jgi:P-loop Domain of unknown function (DUF2791)
MEALSVGYEGIRDLVLDRIILLGERHRVEPLFVRGEWGTGKSHFISYVRTICRDLEIASSTVNLNARGHALNHLQRAYPLLAEAVELGRLPSGLQNILLTKLADREARPRLERFGRRAGSGELGQALASLCLHAESNELPVAEHFAWTTVLGGDLAWANYSYKRTKALARIGALGKLFHALGAGGLVLLLDEAETIDQLWNVLSRKGAYSVLGSLSRMDHVWCIFAVTARFDHTLRSDRRRILSDPNVSPDARWFLTRWYDGALDVFDPPKVDETAARSLARKVEDLYERAYVFRLQDRAGVSNCVKQWLGDPARNPRTLLRSLVDHLDRRRPLSR